MPYLAHQAWQHRKPGRDAGMAPPRRPVRVLILEDNPSDAELMADELRQTGLDPRWERVETECDFTARLEAEFDLILSDYSLPQFNGLQALQLVRARGLDIPFILVSGSIGEDIAVEAMRKGADDYLLKDRMARLGPAALQALEKRDLRTDTRRAESSRRESEERFRQIAENIHEVFWLTDPAKNEMLYISPGYEEIWGRSCDSLYAAPHTWTEAIHPEDRHRVLDGLQARQARGDYDEEYRICRPDGTIRWIHDKAFPVLDATGRVARVTGVAEDITQRKQAETHIQRLNRVHAMLSAINTLIIRVRDKEALFDGACRIAVERGNFGIAWIGLFDARTLEVTPVAWAGMDAESIARTKGTARSEVPQGQGILGRAMRERRTVFENDMTAQPAVGGQRRAEAIRRGYRSQIVLPLIVRGEVVASFALFARDANFFNQDELALLQELADNISFTLQSIARQEELDYLSYYDALTGLANRSLFMDRLGHHMHARNGERRIIALVLLDIERFRNINETLGRKGGDELLRAAAQRLEPLLHGRENLARIGSNSFGILLREPADLAGVTRVVENDVFACFGQPFVIAENEIPVSMKAGIAVYPHDGHNAENLFRNAEAALKRAKASGERYTFYASEMNARAAEVLSMEARLRKAVAARQFLLHYQPKIRLSDRRLCGLEALIRWQVPGRGLVPPASFIPLLEQTGLILEVGKWVLAQALGDYRGWKARGLAAPRVAVNVSAIQLQQKNFVDTVISEVQEAGDTPEALELEVTESLMMSNVESNTRALSVLRGTGIHVSIDDFGTGYSSLSYVARLPLDALKIDQSFIACMSATSDDLAIVSTIINLAHSLKLQVVAEGVETDEQCKLLTLMKCDQAQGYLFSKPLPAHEIELLLAAPQAG